MAKDIIKFLEKQEIPYNSLEQYEIAMTHMSFVNEQNLEHRNSYERLEFLGDSVLGLAISKWLFIHSVNKTPGEMTLLRSKVVNKTALAKISRDLNLHKLLRLGKGENRSQLSDSVMEDIFEALVGAIYIDAGFPVAEAFIEKYVAYRIANIDMDDIKDYKTKLQEHLQANNRSNVEYKTIKEEKKKDGIIFHVEVLFDGVTLGKGSGVSKKKAQQDAAKSAYGKLVK